MTPNKTIYTLYNIKILKHCKKHVFEYTHRLNDKVFQNEIH